MSGSENVTVCALTLTTAPTVGEVMVHPNVPPRHRRKRSLVGVLALMPAPTRPSVRATAARAAATLRRFMGVTFLLSNAQDTTYAEAVIV